MLDLPLQKNFVSSIEYMVEKNGLSYIDAVLYYCENYNIEIEAVAEIIQKNAKLKSYIELEAENLHFLKKISRLPI